MFSRRLLLHGPDPAATPVLIQDRAVAGCWFELHRRGGCGAAEIVLQDEFPDRRLIDIGDWISFEAAPDDRWYLGRVEERQASSPAQVRLRLAGMGVELTEVFPGGFASDADGVPPHRFAATDLFPHDPDRSLELFDSVDSADALARLLLEQYVLPAAHITRDPALIESPLHAAPVSSLKFRGEESVAAVIKELALRAQAAWGVDARGRFFFLQPRAEQLAVWREGRDLTSLSETRDREHLFNRVLLTGDYIYDHRDASDDIALRSFRWRGNYTQPDSRAEFGDRRIRLWIPWLRTAVDSLAFVREFFHVYAQPAARYQIETGPQVSLPLPWAGRVRLEDRAGATLFLGPIESIRVAFDHAPRFRLELGPEDPRNLWPEPPHDERWELPAGSRAGGVVSLSDRPPLTSSAPSSDAGSLSSSDPSSAFSSDDSLDGSTGETFASSLSGSSFNSSGSSADASTGDSSDGESSDESTAASTGSQSSASDHDSSASDSSDSDDSSNDSSADDSGDDDSSESFSSDDSSHAGSSGSSAESSTTTSDPTSDDSSTTSHDSSAATNSASSSGSTWTSSSGNSSGVASSTISGSTGSSSGSSYSGSYSYSDSDSTST